jgi:aspartate-semialdehyde dehydrogenase
MSSKYTIALVGATGTVGREILNILDELDFPVETIIALASRKSLNQEVYMGDRMFKVKSLESATFDGVDIAFFAAGSDVAKKYAPKAAAAGAVVIDNSSHFRMDDDVPLVVPEVNGDAIAGYKAKNIIANPNCSTVQLVVALKPLHDEVKIKRIVVSTYQSVSGAGNAAMDELFTQTRATIVNDAIVAECFPKQIAFNVIPHIDAFIGNGNTKEEQKMINETHKILDPDIAVAVTCVRVPTFVGHGEAVNIEFHDDMPPGPARKILREAPGCSVFDKREDAGYITPLDCSGDHDVYISRIRKDDSVPHGLNMWVVSDNLRKGAALNAVQIAEELVKRYLSKG